MADREIRIKVVVDDRGVDRLDGGLKRSQGSAFNLKKALGGVSAVLGAIAASRALRYVIDTASAYEDLRVRLKVTEGSLESAGQAWKRLSEFSAQTPFQLQQIVDSHILLRNVGLNPTRETLEALGDTAAAQGKDIQDFTRAAVSAAFGEAEGLKQFGILMRKEGDDVAVTFKGQTERIRGDAQSIIDHLVQIGQTNFAGAMEERSKTLSGSLSTLRDNVALLADEAGTGLLPALTEIAGKMTEISQNEGSKEALRDFGETVGTILNAIGSALQWVGERWGTIKAVAYETMGAITRVVTETAAFIVEKFGQAFQFLSLGIGGESNIGRQAVEMAASIRQAGVDIQEGFGIKAVDAVSRLNNVLSATPDLINEAGNAADNVAPKIDLLGSKIAAAMKAGAAETESLIFGSAPNTDILDPILDDLSEAQRIIADTVTEEEKYLRFVTQVEGLEQKGLLTKEQAAEALRQATMEVSEFVSESERANTVWGQIAGTLGSLAIGGLTQVLFNDKSTKDALTDFGSSAGSLFGDILKQQGEETGKILGVNAGSALGVAIPVLGSALGSLAGAKLGEFLGGIFGDSPKVVGTVTGGTGGFSGSGVDAATGGASFLNSQLLELESILGTTAITLSDLSIRVKDNGAIWVQIANEASVKFKDMNEALNYAFTELIRSAQLPADVAGQLQTVIANSTTENADELLADLQFVQGLINATQGEITVGFRQVVTEFHQNVQRLNELGLDGSLAFGALSQSLSDMRNQILGINESAADRIRRQAAEFNAELAILKAEQTAKLVDLKLRAEVVQGQGQITKAAIQSDLAYINGMHGVATATAATAGVAVSSAQTIGEAIAAIEHLLETLPEAISDADIRAAIGRAGGGRGVGNIGNIGADLGDIGKGIGKIGRSSGFAKSKLDSVREALDQLAEFRSSLLTSAQSPVPIDQQILVAQREFQRAFNRASRGGRKGSENVGDFISESQQYLDILRRAFGSGAGFQAGFRDILAKTEGLEDIFGEDLDKLLKPPAEKTAKNTEQLVISSRQMEANTRTNAEASRRNVEASLGVLEETRTASRENQGGHNKTQAALRELDGAANRRNGELIRAIRESIERIKVA